MTHSGPVRPLGGSHRRAMRVKGGESAVTPVIITAAGNSALARISLALLLIVIVWKLLLGHTERADDGRRVRGE